MHSAHCSATDSDRRSSFCCIIALQLGHNVMRIFRIYMFGFVFFTAYVSHCVFDSFALFAM